MSDCLDVVDGNGAGSAIDEGIQRNILSLDKLAQTGTLDRDGVDEHLSPAIIGLDKAETFRFIVGLHFTCHHHENLSALQSAHARILATERSCVVLDVWRERSARLRAKGETDHVSGQSR